jgi:hypothetical protein
MATFPTGSRRPPFRVAPGMAQVALPAGTQFVPSRAATPASSRRRISSPKYSIRSADPPACASCTPPLSLMPISASPRAWSLHGLAPGWQSCVAGGMAGEERLPVHVARRFLSRIVGSAPMISCRPSGASPGFLQGMGSPGHHQGGRGAPTRRAGCRRPRTSVRLDAGGTPSAACGTAGDSRRCSRQLNFFPARSAESIIAAALAVISAARSPGCHPRRPSARRAPPREGGARLRSLAWPRLSDS